MFFIPEALTDFFGLCTHPSSSEGKQEKYLASFLSPNLAPDTLAAFFRPTHLPFSLLLPLVFRVLVQSRFPVGPLFLGHRTHTGTFKGSGQILTACWNNSKTCLLRASRFVVPYTRRDHVLIHTDHRPGPFPQTLKNRMAHELSFSFNHTIFH